MRIKRILVSQRDSRKYYVSDLDKDYHTKFGFVKSNDLKTKKLVESNTKEKFVVYDAGFIENYVKLKRLPQIISLKDIGYVIAKTGLGKDSVVVDAGSGSGATACFLANVVKKVHTFDVEEKHAEIVHQNIEDLELKNVIAKHHDIYTGIPVKSYDALILDLPEPWRVWKHTKGLRAGGFVVCYSPCIPPLSDFIEQKPDNFILVETVEVTVRKWEFKERKIRPKSSQIMHSGFLSIFQKIKA